MPSSCFPLLICVVVLSWPTLFLHAQRDRTLHSRGTHHARRSIFRHHDTRYINGSFERDLRVVSFRRGPRDERRITLPGTSFTGLAQAVHKAPSAGRGPFATVISNTAIYGRVSLILPVLAVSDRPERSRLVVCEGDSLPVVASTDQARAQLRTACQLYKIEHLLSAGWLCVPTRQKATTEPADASRRLIVALLVNNTHDARGVHMTFASKPDAPPSPQFRAGKCQQALARMTMTDWGLEQPRTIACDEPASSCATATSLAPITVDMVIAAFSSPSTLMVKAILAALPDHVRERRIFYYFKGPKQEHDLADLQQLPPPARLVSVGRLPNVGRCDHTYLHHIVQNYHSLGNVTLFLKDTTALHAHLSQMTNVLGLARTMPPTLKAWCVRGAGWESRNFELPTYKSEQCWRFGRCYGDEQYRRATITPLGNWLDNLAGRDSETAKPGFVYSCMGGIFAASASAVRSTSLQTYRKLSDEMDDGDSLEAGHYMERAWFHLFNVRSEVDTKRSTIAVYGSMFCDDNHPDDTTFISAVFRHDSESEKLRTRLEVDFLFFSNCPRLLNVAKNRGWKGYYIGLLQRDDALLSETTLKVAPHRLPQLDRYDYTVYVDVGRLVNLDAVAETIVNDLATSAASVVCGLETVRHPRRPNHIIGALLLAMKSHRIHVARTQIQTYLHEHQESGANMEYDSLLSTAFIIRRMTAQARRFGELWLDECVQAGTTLDSVVLHFVRQRYGEAITITTSPVLKVEERAFPLSKTKNFDPTPRTWVFVATAQSDDRWVNMTKMAIKSARLYTTLRKVCIFYGPPESSFAQWLQEQADITFINHSPAWVSMIEDAVAVAGKDNIRWSPLYGSVHSLVATFLRIDVPLLLDHNKFGPIVLYTDTDVMFTRDVSLADFGEEVPPFFIMGTEADGEYNPSVKGSGNAGIMLMNLHGLCLTYRAFLEYVFSLANVNRGLHFGEFGPGDQGAYNSFYYGYFNVVSWPKFNWKPYWPLPERLEDVALVHFHGPKPWHYDAWFNSRTVVYKVYENIFNWCLKPRAGCEYWLKVVESMDVHF